MDALERLEAAGVPVLTSLAEVPQRRLWEVLHGIPPEPQSIPILPHAEGVVTTVLTRWLCGQGTRSPTWASLYHHLTRLDLKELSQHIEDHLTDGECVNIF